jgi:nucleotide-binding universal stress UspA family protein
MFQSTLICTDFADSLYRLVNFVPSLASSGMKRIVFHSVVPLLDDRGVPRPDQDKLEKARDRLSTALQNVPDGIEVKVDVQSGRPGDVIIQASKTYKSDLIIVGMPSRSRLDEKIFGSTTKELCQRVTTPILTLRPQLISTYTTEELDLRCRHLFRCFLIPYDGTDPANYIVQRIKHYAQHQRSKSLTGCVLSWVIDEGGRKIIPKEYQIEQDKEKLAVVKADLETVGLRVETEVRTGEPILEILAAAAERDISVIAASSATMGKLIEWTTPSFASEILSRSWHPVLYFPPIKDQR